MGRMGQSIDALAFDRDVEIVARIDDGVAISRESLRDAQVAIEFTQPDAAAANVRACLKAGIPVVVGTTGWYDQLAAVSRETSAAGGALLSATNFSVGVAIMDILVARAAELFAATSGFEAHLVETHHSAKKDAPSGTATTLASTYERAAGQVLPVTSVRVGSVPGTHELVFDGPFEQLRLVHEARDRRVFAEGALIAARWLVGRTGVYTMRDVLAHPLSTHHSHG